MMATNNNHKSNDLCSDSILGWAKTICGQKSFQDGTAIGLVSGSRYAPDRRVIDQLAQILAQQLATQSPGSKMLVLRLDVFKSAKLDRAVDQYAGQPKQLASPFGNWMDATIPVPIGRGASWSLLHIPKWLAAWRKSYQLVLIDLGPINQVPSRVVGRLCKSNFLLLGPDSCASNEWIQQHVAWHQQCRSEISGSLLTTINLQGSSHAQQRSIQAIQRAA